MSASTFRDRAYSLWKDIGERAVWTFVQTFVSVEAFDTWFEGAIIGRLNLQILTSIYIAAGAATMAVIKGYLASRVPVKVGPSTAAFPEPVDTDVTNKDYSGPIQ